MTDRNKTRNPPSSDWEGFAEIDRAIAENRITSYRWKKTWADPWGRLKLISVILGLIAFAVYLLIDEGVVVF